MLIQKNHIYVIFTDWWGFIYLIIFCLNAGYAGTRLGISWNIIEERYPEYKGSSRAPYCIIAEKAVGKWGRYKDLFQPSEKVYTN